MLYCLENDKGRRIQRVAHELGMTPKLLENGDAGQKVGYCAGLPGFRQEEPSSMEGLREEALIFSGLSRSRLNQLLDAMKKADVASVNLKAMVTATNASWTVAELLQELAKEHEIMGAYQQLWAQIKAAELLDISAASDEQRAQCESALAAAKALTSSPPESKEALLQAKQALLDAFAGLPVRSGDA